MDSEILNIEDIVMGRGLPDPPPVVPPVKPAEKLKPILFQGPPAGSVQSCKCIMVTTLTQFGESHWKIHCLRGLSYLISFIFPDQHENLQCFQCFITFCSAKAKERHMKKSHREEYKQQLQQVGFTLSVLWMNRGSQEIFFWVFMKMKITLHQNNMFFKLMYLTIKSDFQ